jgi:hypothetical protein
MTSALQVVGALREKRFILSDEKDLQSQIAGALDAAAIDYQREVIIGARERVDFMIFDGIAVEVKIKGGKLAIYRQLKRYAESDQVREIILLSSVSMGLPLSINGKPTHFLSLGEQWL